MQIMMVGGSGDGRFANVHSTDHPPMNYNCATMVPLRDRSTCWSEEIHVKHHSYRLETFDEPTRYGRRKTYIYVWDGLKSGILETLIDSYRPRS
jgi:hypothetical protein